ncbi:MAG TPA: alpha/beta hydrolase [Anaerolineae bacterium]|nr:alpha/beta hydrolase [Anaerolineae bacterium]
MPDKTGTLYHTTHSGGGPAVVLIHGAGGSHLAWPPALRRLPSVTTYAVDLPGHGRSGGTGRERIEEYAADLVGFLDALGIEQAVLIGHSMGGAIAQTVALAHPRRVDGLVLLATAARLRVAPAILEGLETDFERTIRLISQWAWGPGADPLWIERGREMMEACGPHVLRKDFLACDRFDIRNRVTEISCPTLVLVGSEDRMTPLRFGQWLADQLPKGKFVLVEGAGHMLMLERPQEVLEVVTAFLLGNLGKPPAA